MAVFTNKKTLINNLAKNVKIKQIILKSEFILLLQKIKIRFLIKLSFQIITKSAIITSIVQNFSRQKTNINFANFRVSN